MALPRGRAGEAAFVAPPEMDERKRRSSDDDGDDDEKEREALLPPAHEPHLRGKWLRAKQKKKKKRDARHERQRKRHTKASAKRAIEAREEKSLEEHQAELLAELKAKRMARERRRAEEQMAEAMREQLALDADSDDEEEDAPFWKKRMRDNEFFTWDYCMVFAVGAPDKMLQHPDDEWEQISEEELFKQRAGVMIQRLHEAGLATSAYYSVQRDELYCLIGAPERRLQAEADRINYDVQLDTLQLLRQGREKGMPLCEVAADLKETDEYSYRNWLPLYAKYDEHPRKDPRSKLYMRHDEGPLHHGTIFRGTDRLRITDAIIEADKVVNGAGLSPNTALADDAHPLIAYFPLHDAERRAALKKDWLRWSAVRSQPLDAIRAYYGEKVGVYFAFLGFYCRSLFVPSAVGAILWVWQILAGRIDVEWGVLLFGVFMALWSTLMLEFWKREEATLRVRWGMSEFATKEQTRPEFEGEIKRSPIDGALGKSFSPMKALLRALFSQAVIWTLICVVIISVVGIMLLRDTLESWDATYGGILTAIINAVQIQLLNVFYGTVSHKLNDWENHRTDSEWENALIAKSFLFKFVNSYNSLFYIAFFKRYDLGCVDDDCLGELQIQLGTIFIAMIIINNALELGAPAIKNWMTARANAAQADDAPPQGLSSRDDIELGAAGGGELPKSPAEQEFELEPYESTFDDFEELVIQYGFVTLFVVAFPLTPLLAVLNNIVEIRVDATKISDLTRRPPPDGASDIGTWYDVLLVMAYISVFTNVAIISFNTEQVDDWANGERWGRLAFFLGLEHLLLFVKAVVAYFVPDEPHSVGNHRMRQKYLVDVLIDQVEEEQNRVLIMENLFGHGDHGAGADGAGGGDLEAESGSDGDAEEREKAEKEKAEGEKEEPLVAGRPASQFWQDVAQAGPEAEHLISENRLDIVEGRAKWRSGEDENQEFPGARDKRMSLALVQPMQSKCLTGGFTMQPPEFWLLYDLHFLGTIYASQVIWLRFSGNAVLPERRVLKLMLEAGGVEEIAFPEEDFAAYVRWWLDHRRPKWSIYLSVDPLTVNVDWIRLTVARLEPAVPWVFELTLTRDGIIVEPQTRNL